MGRTVSNKIKRKAGKIFLLANHYSIGAIVIFILADERGAVNR